MSVSPHPGAVKTVPATAEPPFPDAQMEHAFQSFWREAPSSLYLDELVTRNKFRMYYTQQRTNSAMKHDAAIADVAEKLVPDVLRACDSIVADPKEIVDRAYALAEAMYARRTGK